MKTLVFINGPNGVGKSTTGRQLFSRLPNSCCIESEWCRSINPFDLTPEVQQLTAKNMSMLIRNYFECSLVDHIILIYGLHGPRKQIFESVIDSLQDVEYKLLPITLKCNEEENIRRMQQDNRNSERIQKALEQSRPIYEIVNNPTIDTTYLTIDETVEKILEVLESVSRI